MKVVPFPPRRRAPLPWTVIVATVLGFYAVAAIAMACWPVLAVWMR